MRIKLRSALAVGSVIAVAAMAAMVPAPGAHAAITASPLVNPVSGKCLDVTGSSSADGTAVEIWTCHGGANQAWTSTASNQLQVTIGGVTKCLDAYGGGTANGTKLIIWSCHGGANQQWLLNSNSTISGVASSRCVDIAGASTANGAPVLLWDCKAAADNNQRWTPGGTTPPPPPPGDGSFRSPIYFMPVENNPQAISTAMSASGARYFNLAFVNDIGGCTPGWGAGRPVSSDTSVAAIVNTVRAGGGDVAVSFGGYISNELGASCGGASSLANAYQAVINKYNLTRLDFDWEGDDLDANMSVRMGALRILQDNARAAGRQLHLTLTVPMTTVGFSGSDTDEIRQGIANGVTFDLINIMAFDYGLTNASNMTDSVKLVADAAKNQMKSIFGYDDATAYAHLGLQLMNGHTDQPSELFLQADFTNLLAYARANHFGWFSYWALNRDRACDPSIPHPWADGTCSSVSQQPWDFSKIVAQYNG